MKKMPKQCLCGDPSCSACFPSSYQRSRYMEKLSQRGLAICNLCERIVKEEETKEYKNQWLCIKCYPQDDPVKTGFKCTYCGKVFFFDLTGEEYKLLESNNLTLETAPDLEDEVDRIAAKICEKCWICTAH